MTFKLRFGYNLCKISILLSFNFFYRVRYIVN